MRYINGPLRPACQFFFQDTPPVFPGGNLGRGHGLVRLLCELTVCPPGIPMVLLSVRLAADGGSRQVWETGSPVHLLLCHVTGEYILDRVGCIVTVTYIFWQWVIRNQVRHWGEARDSKHGMGYHSSPLNRRKFTIQKAKLPA